MIALYTILYASCSFCIDFLQAQYKSNFVAAIDSAPKTIPTGIHEPENPNPLPDHSNAKRRKKSRWD